ncbi:MAG TPA: LLM class F420-dependent oxidoreductase [Chloroflexia bacterium]|nr:LLM class F420-dependent oxidoreductase [Chloroflexia bacterium]
MTVKFGAFAPQGWRMDLVEVNGAVEKYEAMTAVAVEAERLGFDSVWLYDHFHTVPEPTLEATFEVWTSMAALARDTSTIKLGQLVTCNSFRNPALLAKVASTVDVLSHGRAILGLGAGWAAGEYEAYGYELPYPDTAERLARLGEAAQVILKMWTEPHANFEGKYYRVKDAINEPKGVQQPHIPLWIGGAGEKVTLKLVAKYADACNVTDSTDPAFYRHKFEVLRKHCQEQGRDFNSILKTASFTVYAAHNRQELEQLTVPYRGGRSLEELARGSAVGTPEELIQTFRGMIEAGVEYFACYFAEPVKMHSMRLFAEEVMPALVELQPGN